MRVNQPIVDLLSAPSGARISQLLFGERFTVEKTEGSYSFGSASCGYQGWIPSKALAQSCDPSHRVSNLGTYVYTQPDMKSDLRLRLPYMAKLNVIGHEGKFSKTPEGYVFSRHLCAEPAGDFVIEAERFLGVPYLWGGRSNWGIDCSGLVQLCLAAVNIHAPRDSGPQAQSLGKAQPANTPLLRGDLIFWNGHVGIMKDHKTLLHATAFTMSVLSEPLDTAITRIQTQGNGGVKAIRRV